LGRKLERAPNITLKKYLKEKEELWKTQILDEKGMNKSDGWM
jgi:hypothetical protein